MEKTRRLAWRVCASFDGGAAWTRSKETLKMEIDDLLKFLLPALAGTVSLSTILWTLVGLGVVLLIVAVVSFFLLSQVIKAAWILAPLIVAFLLYRLHFENGFKFEQEWANSVTFVVLPIFLLVFGVFSFQPTANLFSQFVPLSESSTGLSFNAASSFAPFSQADLFNVSSVEDFAPSTFVNVIAFVSLIGGLIALFALWRHD